MIKSDVLTLTLEQLYAGGVLTSDNTNVSNGDTVTIGSKVYTFKTSLTASTTDGEVLIGADADDSLLNLKKAINGESGGGTKYGSLTPVNTQVISSAVASHALTMTAITIGIAANAIATTETSSHLSWGATTLVGGASGDCKTANLKGAGTYYTQAIDVSNYNELLAFISTVSHAGTTPTNDVKFQASHDKSAWVDIGDAFTQITTSDALTFKRLTANFGAFLRAVLVLGGTKPEYVFDLKVACKG